MNAEAGQGGVGHGVDQTAHEVGALGAEAPVLAAERHDPRRGRLARLPRETIDVEPGADEEPIGLDGRPIAELEAKRLPAQPMRSTPVPVRTSAPRSRISAASAPQTAR